MLITWTETLDRLRQDRERLASVVMRRGVWKPRLWILYPPYTCVFLHRLSHYLFVRGHRWSARILWHVNLVTMGSDLSPLSNLGGGLVIMNPVATTIHGRAGRNLTIMPLAGLGSGPSIEDIGAGPGLPVLGDDVELAVSSAVFGPWRIGDRVRIGTGCIVMRNVADDSVLEMAPVRILRAPKAE